jgi:hypothetical protein
MSTATQHLHGVSRRGTKPVLAYGALLVAALAALWLIEDRVVKFGLLALVAMIMFAMVLSSPRVRRAGFEQAMRAFMRADYVRAARALMPLAQDDDPRAQTNLGFLYASGCGVTRDDADAVRWYRRAAEQGYAPAQFNLAHMFADGRGCPQSQEQALGWYRKAAQRSFPPAQRSLARYYEAGLGIAANAQMAADLYYRAGIGFLCEGERDEAHATLAALERLDPTHPLTIDLRNTLRR